MKNVNEIINEINQKQIPNDLQTIQAYSDSIYQVTGSISAVFSVLITKAREQYFTSSSEWLNWVKDNYQIQKSHAMHSLSVGRMLMQCDTDTYAKLVRLSHDKLYTVSSLAPEEIPAFVQTHELDSMTREAIRSAVNPTQDITAKPSSQTDKTVAKFIDLADVTIKMTMQDLQDVIKASSDIADIIKILEAGKRMITIGLESARLSNVQNLDLYNRLELYLAEQVKDIQARKTVIYATNTGSNTNISKTA